MGKRERLLKYRRPAIVAFEMGLVVVANYAAFWLRFDGEIPDRKLDLLLAMLPLLVAIRALTFAACGLYRGLWRYAGIWDLRNIVVAVSASSLLFYPVVHFGFDATEYPRSVFLIDALLMVFLLGGIRLSRRIHRELTRPGSKRRVLIYGAGDAGEMVVRDMHNDPGCGLEPIGFIDDNPNKRRATIHGLSVFGGRDALERVIARYDPTEVLVAMPSASAEALRAVVSALERFELPIKTLPSLREIVDGHSSTKQIRPLALEDLLTRAPVGLDFEPVRAFLRGKRVLVTGAGGSIGSEISRQVAACGLEALVLLDKSEGALFEIDGEVGRRWPELSHVMALIDVRDGEAISRAFAVMRPQVVFHAAAFKHVPMMEIHPEQAVLNNVGGTRAVVDAALGNGVERLILISSDKAANPVGVMGATKRLAELYLRARAASANGGTVLSAVRFGNVLGSSGSVVPTFLRQIECGGPVLVTHPDVTRYFMTIPEAVQLVLLAMVTARGGETFVLDMGAPIPIVDLARHLIRLSGRVPEHEIAIEFIGLRPGEKLHEDLYDAGETLTPSGVERIFAIQANGMPSAESLSQSLDALEAAALAGDRAALLRNLGELVPAVGTR